MVDGGVDVEEHARDVEQLLVNGVVHLIRDPVQSKNRCDSYYGHWTKQTESNPHRYHFSLD